MSGGKYTRTNIALLNNKLKKIKTPQHVKVVDDSIIPILRDIALKAIGWFDENAVKYGLNNDTYNLRDSIGVGLFKQGILIDIVAPSPKASVAHQWTYHKVQYETKGHDKLLSVLANTHKANMNEYNFVLICAAPYGFFLDRGLGPDKLGNGDASKAGYGWWTDGLIPFINKYVQSKLNEIP